MGAHGAYFAETNSNRVRVLKPDGTIALFAGLALLYGVYPSNDVDGGPVTSSLVSAAPILFTADGSGSGSGAIVKQDGTGEFCRKPRGARFGRESLRNRVSASYGTIAGNVQVCIASQTADYSTRAVLRFWLTARFR
jgi:hypothetical protein